MVIERPFLSTSVVEVCTPYVIRCIRALDAENSGEDSDSPIVKM